MADIMTTRDNLVAARAPARKRLKRMLSRPWYLPQATREEIVAAAIAKLHEQISAISHQEKP